MLIYFDICGSFCATEVSLRTEILWPAKAKMFTIWLFTESLLTPALGHDSPQKKEWILETTYIYLEVL